jgi:predicted phosphodiesterase
MYRPALMYASAGFCFVPSGLLHPEISLSRRSFPMRIAVLSDIHGNGEALRGVLDDLGETAVDGIVSLGDNVGYGPDPERVMEILAERGILSVLGNHELGLLDASFLSWFNPSARESLAITRRLLTPGSMERIRAFQRSCTLGSTLLVHGCPPGSVTRYFFEVDDLEWRRLLDQMSESICFVGHTHELAMVEYDGTDVRTHPLGCGQHRLGADRRYVINAGSVGQPRDGDRRAKYVLWDDENLSLEVRCVSYDVETTVRKILDLGFPRINASRLL